MFVDFRGLLSIVNLSEQTTVQTEQIEKRKMVNIQIQMVENNYPNSIENINEMDKRVLKQKLLKYDLLNGKHLNFDKS